MIDLSNKKFYARICKWDENYEEKLNDIIKGQDPELYIDKVTMTANTYPNRDKMIKSLQEGDWVVTPSLLSIARNTKDFIETVDTILLKGANIYFIEEGVSTQVQSPYIDYVKTHIKLEDAFEKRKKYESAIWEAGEPHFKKKKRRGISLSDTEIDAFIVLYNSGLTISAIANNFGANRSTVKNWVKRLIEEGLIEKRSESTIKEIVKKSIQKRWDRQRARENDRYYNPLEEYK